MNNDENKQKICNAYSPTKLNKFKKKIANTKIDIFINK
jgi:hypothetical protein